MTKKDLIVAENLSKIYRRGSEDIKALNNINLNIKENEMLAVVGPSGSGKTTLVNILGCLDNPSSGTLKIAGQEIFTTGKQLSEKKLTLIRRQYFGYVFQKFFLIPTLTVRENIILPTVFNSEIKVDEKYLLNLLDLLGISHRLEHLPAELSGGEMQRVAIARALITKPKILIADEPTGNLDSQRTEEIKNLLLKLKQEQNLTIILVTHNPEFAKTADKILTISDGEIKNV